MHSCSIEKLPAEAQNKG